MKLNFIMPLVLAILLWNASESRAAIYTSTTSYAIADYPGPGTASAITVGDAGTVSAVNNVTFSILGGWAGDYSVVLQYTDGGTTISSTLFSGLKSGLASNYGFDNVVLTASTGPAIADAGSFGSTASSALTGTFSGLNYDLFSGVSSAGDWILFVTDNQSGDCGTLTGWSLGLNVATVPEPVTSVLVMFGSLVLLWGGRRPVAYRNGCKH